MGLELIDIVKEELQKGKRVCYAFITNKEGSSPRGIGTSMIIREDESIFGTIGGGSIEYKTMLQAKKCLEQGISKTLEFDVEFFENESKSKIKAGKVEVFIKTYLPKHRLIIIGAGHVAYSLYKIASITGFSVVVLDNRKELLTKEKYPDASDLLLGDVEEETKNFDFKKSDYVVIASGSTKLDEKIIEIIIKNELAYIGMLGSKKKIKSITSNLLGENIDIDLLANLYAPIGLELNGETPEEVALSILSEIILIKNKGKLSHMKSI